MPLDLTSRRPVASIEDCLKGVKIGGDAVPSISLLHLHDLTAG